MAFATLRDFIQHLEHHQELARVKAPVDPVLEMTEIADRMIKSAAPHGSNEPDQHPAARLGGKSAFVREPGRFNHSRSDQHLWQLLAGVSGAGM
ncbi:MAG: hypothetical protein KatS3mg104_2160 [Phycisphaerae bacterium]|nr:MAG: hypothetical protein KatS3mg104_2160 [Phycisphaerae bacterium]